MGVHLDQNELEAYIMFIGSDLETEKVDLEDFQAEYELWKEEIEEHLSGVAGGKKHQAF